MQRGGLHSIQAPNQQIKSNQIKSTHMILYMRLLAEPSAITTTSAAVSAVRLGLNRVLLLPLPPCRFRTLPYCFQVLAVRILVLCAVVRSTPPSVRPTACTHRRAAACGIRRFGFVHVAAARSRTPFRGWWHRLILFEWIWDEVDA
jgi:hypothetical protein